jgi:hypothetical protein
LVGGFAGLLAGPADRFLAGLFRGGPRFAFGPDVLELLVGQMFNAYERVVRCTRSDELIELTWMAAPSRFCEI